MEFRKVAAGKTTPAGRDSGKRTTPDCRVAANGVSAVSVPSSEYCILHACVTVTLLHYCSIRSYNYHIACTRDINSLHAVTLRDSSVAILNC